MLSITGRLEAEFGELNSDCERIEGRIIAFGESLMEEATSFVSHCKWEESVEVLDGKKAEESNELAGFALHPSFSQLVVNETLNFKM